MPVQKLKRFLDENEVKHMTIGHSQAFTAQEVADSHTELVRLAYEDFERLARPTVADKVTDARAR